MDDPCVSFFFFIFLFFYFKFCFGKIRLFIFVFILGEANSFFFFFLEQLKFGVAGVKINETVLQQTRKLISISLENILLRKTNSYV